MSDHRIDLEDRAKDTVSDALYGMTTYDKDALAEAVQERCGEEADSACIYTHHCMTIIQDYEREYGNDDHGDTGETFTAGEWQQAMVAYAYGVAYSALSQMTSTILAEIDEAAEEVADLVEAETGQRVLDIGRDCPHGWARHDREDDQGTHFWEPAELEGCKAIARECNGVWLSYTWTPEPAVA